MLGIIGGSGVYQLEGLKNAQWHEVSTPFGRPSDAVLIGELDGVKTAFLPRHGRGHRIPPHQINARANVVALKSLGVTDILSVSAVGSLREDLAPGTFVLVDQFIDFTNGRPTSFFDEGYVGHVSMAHPVCGRLTQAVASAAGSIEGGLRRGGTYLCIEGPQFSSQAESRLFRQWGADVIGMTQMPEAKLAREAELCFATVAMVTDFDCWHPDHDAVTAAQVIKTLTHNAEKARELVRLVIPALKNHPARCPSGCDAALTGALMTAPERRDPGLAHRLAQAKLVPSAAGTADDRWSLKSLIRTVHDYPKKGIAFRDVTTLLENADGFRRAVEALVARYRSQRIDKVVGIDARGFIFGGALAMALGCGFVPARKRGKLPGTTLHMEYALEYGTDALEISSTALGDGQRVVVVDDLIATGGTAEATVKLCRLRGAEVVEACFAIELPDLKGSQRLMAAGCPTFSLCQFEGD